MKNQKKLKIAMLGHKRIPSREGGIEVVEELAVRMVEKGHEVTCFNRLWHHVVGEEFDKERFAEYRGVRCHATNEGGYISWYDFCVEFYKQYRLSKVKRPINSRYANSNI